ncbi:MAG: carbon-nitrogen hydrolase family protein [Phycisphaerales bacterium]|nr:carbon-nitrogen hydrolase family protein [Phycisphaerales bacterium]
MDSAADVWPALERQVRAAGEGGADLVVLPEIAYPSYLLESRKRYFQGDIEQSAAVLQRFAALTREFGAWIVAGFVESKGDALYNSAAIIDRTGQCVSIARKQFLWDCDNEWFEPGRESLVVSTPWGRMGVLICADLRMPEITATLVARGAEFIVQPTAWVNAAFGTSEFRNIQPEFLVRARAIEFGVPFASCSKSGRERSRMGYVGRSMIVDAHGTTLAQAPTSGDATVVADLTPAAGCVVRIDDADLACLMSEPSPMPAVDASRIVRLDLSRGVDIVVRMAVDEGVAVGLSSASKLANYVFARMLTMKGTQLIVAVGEAPDMSLVRARAAENRVYVCLFSKGGNAIVVGPNGDPVQPEAAESNVVSIRPAEASVKRFTPATPIWEQRRVETYCFVPESD